MTSQNTEWAVWEFDAPIDPDAVVRVTLAGRIPIHLYYHEELSVAEIAGILGKSEGTVKSRLFRARALLRERLGALLDGDAPRPRRRPGRRALAACAVCAALIVSALGAGPTVWQALQARLGPFGDYAAPLEETCVSQGIQLKAVGSVSDGLITRIYLTATDLTGDRLNGHTRADRLGVKGEWLSGAISYGLTPLSYDADTKTLLMELGAEGLDFTQPVSVGIGALMPGDNSINVWPDLSGVTTAALETERTQAGAEVLRAGQNPQALEGAEGLSVSSMGFDGQGRFHVRLALEEGYTQDGGIFATPLSDDERIGQEGMVLTQLPGALDICLPAVTAGNWARVESIEIYGGYRGPQADIGGNWHFSTQLERVERLRTDMDFQFGGVHVDWVQVSPLGVAAHFTTQTGGGLFSRDLLEVALADGSRAETVKAGGFVSDGEGYTIWPFREPAALEEITSVRVAGVEIPLAG